MPLSKIPNSMQAALTSSEMPAGNIVQYVPSTFATFQTRFQTSSNSYSASTYSLTITPKSATNIILMSYHLSAYNNSSSHYIYAVVQRVGTGALIQTENATGLGAWCTLSSSASEVAGTTSAITYTIYGRANGGTGYLGWSGGGYSSPSQNFNSFHLMEIAA
tara:strand:- start:19 stop:504 length:486 start_codon:yes stop_codon:yes gene_type:complete